MKIKVLFILFFLFGCREVNNKIIVENQSNILFQTEWRNNNGLNISFNPNDSILQVYDLKNKFGIDYYYQLIGDTLEMGTNKLKSKTISEWNQIYLVENLNKDSFILNRISELPILKINNKEMFKAVRFFRNQKIKMDSLAISGAGWGSSLFDFKITNDQMKLIIVNQTRSIKGGIRKLEQDTISYVGVSPQNLKDEFQELLQLSEVENLEENYPIPTHSPVYSMTLSYNGISKESYGTAFPRGIKNIIKRISKIDKKLLKKNGS